MGTEGEWTIHRMPGYTGFIPGTRHIYGRAFGRIPPLAHLKEKKTESSEISQEVYKPKNVWQVLLPPVKFIPGYTGHLPGKNYVFGKTFAQQAEECFLNLNRATQRNQEQKMRQQEMIALEQENKNRLEAEHNKTAAIAHEGVQNMEESHSRNSNQPSPEKSENPYLNEHYPNEPAQTQDDCNRMKSRYNIEANEEFQQHHDKNQRHRTQSDGLNRYNLERRNPDEMFKHLRYESPLKSRYQSSNDVRSDDYLSKYDQPRPNRTPYPEEAKVQDHPYDYETSNKINSRIQSQMDNLSTQKSKYELTNEVRPAESKYNLPNSYRMNETANDQQYTYRPAANTGDKYDTYNPYNVPDGRLGVNRDAQNLREVASHREFAAEESGALDAKYESSYAAQGPNQDLSKTYTLNDKGGCSCCSGHGEGPVADLATQSHHHAASQQLNPPETALPSETNYTGHKSHEEGSHISASIPPTSMNTRYPIGSEHLQQPTERIQTVPERNSAYSVRGYDRLRPEPKSVKFQESSHNIPPVDSLPKASAFYRTSYDDYNNSAKYFNTSLNPPISGYRGYIPRMNSTSALGLPFATHINSNVKT